MSSKNFRAAFTLVEMLTVLAVIGIVMGFVVPAISGMGRSTALVTAGNTVNNMANLARQHAMSRNTLTALVVLGNQGTDADYRAVAVMEYNRGTGWSQIGGWETLPVGITMDSGDTQACSFLLKSPKPFPFLAATNQESRYHTRGLAREKSACRMANWLRLAETYLRAAVRLPKPVKRRRSR